MRFCTKSPSFSAISQRSRSQPTAQKPKKATRRNRPLTIFFFDMRTRRIRARGSAQAEGCNSILLVGLRGVKRGKIFFDTFANDVEGFLLGFDRHFGQFSHIGKRGLESV